MKTGRHHHDPERAGGLQRRAAAKLAEIAERIADGRDMWCLALMVSVHGVRSGPGNPWCGCPGLTVHRVVHRLGEVKGRTLRGHRSDIPSLGREGDQGKSDRDSLFAITAVTTWPHPRFGSGLSPLRG
ncbi:hypothetical protein [Embleya sp. NPDC001921]